MSAALSEKGAPREILRLWVARVFDLVVSPGLLHETQAVLARDKFRRYLSYGEATEYVSWLRREAVVLDDSAEGLVTGATPDPDDEYLIGLTARSGASYLVSGDGHLLGLPGRVIRDGEGDILARVLTPRGFLRELESSPT